MFNPTRLVLCVGAFAISLVLPHVVTAAPAAAPTPVPIAHPDFSSMQFLTGTWTCHETVRGKDRPDTSTTTIGLDGAYLVGHDVAPPFDKYRSVPIKTDFYTTYNPAKHQWVSIAMDSTGGYFVSTSPGWSGNTMTSTTVISADGATGSDVLTKVSNTQTRDVATSKGANGKVTHVTTICSKS